MACLGTLVDVKICGHSTVLHDNASVAVYGAFSCAGVVRDNVWYCVYYNSIVPSVVHDNA